MFLYIYEARRNKTTVKSQTDGNTVRYNVVAAVPVMVSIFAENPYDANQRARWSLGPAAPSEGYPEDVEFSWSVALLEIKQVPEGSY